MLFRMLFVISCIAVILFATTRRAHADTSMSSSRAPFWQPTPKPIDGDKLTGKNLFEKLGKSCFKVPFSMQERAMRERIGGAVGFEQQTSLGAKSQGLNMLGLSGAGTGAVTWVIMHAGGDKPVVSIIPRLFSGGGGLALSIRF